MKRAAFLLILALAATADADILDKKQRSFLENRRICVRRDTTTIPGSVISYYERNGKPDTKGPAVTTNVIHSITGAEQKNPIQAINEELMKINAAIQAECARLVENNATLSNSLVIVTGQLQAAAYKINTELDELKAEKTDLEEKIADSKYIILRPWLKTKLAAVEARIKVLEALTTGGNNQ